jgi:hypothetical protein
MPFFHFMLIKLGFIILIRLFLSSQDNTFRCPLCRQKYHVETFACAPETSVVVIPAVTQTEPSVVLPILVHTPEHRMCSFLSKYGFINMKTLNVYDLYKTHCANRRPRYTFHIFYFILFINATTARNYHIECSLIIAV